MTAEAQNWKHVLAPWIVRLVAILAAALLGAVGHWLGVDPRTIDKPVPLPVPLDPPDYAPVFGWHRDDAIIADNLDPAKTEQFENTPAGMAALGEDDVFLWRAVRKAAGRDGPWYPNVNQQSVGCCVGTGWKHSADVCQATAIAAGKSFEWKPVSAEAIYAGSRVDVGGGRISGDGSVGAWAKEYVSDRAGIAAMQKYASADLTTFSPTRARDWGRRGVPPDVAAAAKDHPIKGCAVVKSWPDAKRAVQQGYPVAVCSSQGFAMERDHTGRARAEGTWMHCLSLIAVRGAPNEGGFLLNSWGDSAHTGPVWPSDAPVAGFWADAGVVDRMLRQGDSFALADVAGFPARRPDWFIRAPRARPDVVASSGRPRLDLFALKSEVSLSW